MGEDDARRGRLQLDKNDVVLPYSALYQQISGATRDQVVQCLFIWLSIGSRRKGHAMAGGFFELELALQDAMIQTPYHGN